MRLGSLLAAILVIGLGLMGCAPSLDARQSVTDLDKPHHTADGFRNLYIEDSRKNFFNFLAMRYLGNVKWANHAARASEVPVRPLDLEAVLGALPDLRISWLGHSTFLIQKDGLTILTDPIFANRASPFSFAGPKRYIRHVVDYRDLPKIDYVVISHNHYDHLDAAAVEVLGNDPIYLVPLKLRAWFVEQGIEPSRVREFDWWDEAAFSGVSFEAMPSQHWSARGLTDRRKTLWASWLIAFEEGRLWFAGDTGYNPVQFKEIGKATGGVDVALIPIGGYLPQDFMGLYHVNPEEAIRIHQDVGATLSLGMHWGTFPLTAEGPGDPPAELHRQLQRLGVMKEAFQTMTVGETRVLKGPFSRSIGQ